MDPDYVAGVWCDFTSSTPTWTTFSGSPNISLSSGNLQFGTTTATTAASYRSETVTLTSPASYTFSLDIVNLSTVSNFSVELYTNTSNTLTGATSVKTFTSSELANGTTIRYTQAFPTGTTYFFYKLVKASTEIARVKVDNLKFGKAVSRYKAVVVMKADYYPYGMEMPGRTYNAGNYRYGYTGKEQDPELKGNGNSYDFGNRQYDPRLGRWMITDALKEMYPSMSPYCYAGNMPIAAKDPDGNLIIFVNGYLYGVEAGTHDDISAGKAYWTNAGKDGKLYRVPSTDGSLGEYAETDNDGKSQFAFLEAAQEFFGDEEMTFVNGTGEDIQSTAKERRLAGFVYAGEMVENYRNMLETLGPDEKIEIVTHSMGSAYAEGMILYFQKYAPDIAARITTVVHLAPCDARDIKIASNTSHINRIELMISDDKTLYWGDWWTRERNREIPKIDVFGLMYWDLFKIHPKETAYNLKKGRDADYWLNSHTDIKINPLVFDEWIPGMLDGAKSGKGTDRMYRYGKGWIFDRIKVNRKVDISYPSSGSGSGGGSCTEEECD